MQPRKLKSEWQLLGGCRGGNETSNGEQCDEEESEESSSDEDCKDENNYGLEDLDSDAGTDDEDCPRKQVPKWAEDSNLMTALLKQCTMPPDLDHIFATVEMPDLSIMFVEQRERFFKRTSSAAWEQPPQTKSFKHGDGPRAKEADGGYQDEPENMDTFTGSIEDNADTVQGGGGEVQGDDEEADGDQEGPTALSQGALHDDENDDGKRGRESDNSFDEFVPVQELKRPRGWSAWEEKTRQRPAPLQPPRIQTLEYCNMSITAAEDEEGIQVMSQYKDKYMRSEVQLQGISDAQADQRKVAGGVYRCLERDQEGFELVIHKGYMTKTLGIVLRRRQQGKPASLFESFGDMKYEYFKFSKFTDGLRWRQECPDRTPTGYIWTGVGGEMPMPDRATGDVFVFCERVDRDLHFSEGPCERLTEAPGASQSVCSNANCGLVKWHLARKCFRRVGDGQFVELWQDDFALVVFRSGYEKLLWTHPNRRLKKSWWERLENSPQYDAFVPDAGSRKRVHENFPNLPPWHFDPPSYVPHHQSWSDPEPLERVADDSSWYSSCFLAKCKPKFISNWLVVILISHIWK